jgi:dipeptidase E
MGPSEGPTPPARDSGRQSPPPSTRLLLLSNSTVHGAGYLDHAEAEIRAHFEGVGAILFVPFALHDRDGYAAKAADRFARMGLRLTSVHQAPDPVGAVEQADGVFIGGGNTFRLLAELHRQRLLAPIRARVAAGMPYLGSSAGSNVACPTIMTTNDMPIVYPPSFQALNLVPFQINPHYLDPDPGSRHMGETRETRLREFHEENTAPVAGLREGAMLQVTDGAVVLAGTTGMRVFRRGTEPVEARPVADVTSLLHP